MELLKVLVVGAAVRSVPVHENGLAAVCSEARPRRFEKGAISCRSARDLTARVVEPHLAIVVTREHQPPFGQETVIVQTAVHGVPVHEYWSVVAAIVAWSALVPDLDTISVVAERRECDRVDNVAAVVLVSEFVLTAIPSNVEGLDELTCTCASYRALGRVPIQIMGGVEIWSVIAEVSVMCRASRTA
jgi:hypothetical protein